VLLVARALTLGALFHAGLFWSTEAHRGWQRLVAAGAMLPSVLILAGMAGEAVTRVVRGYPLNYLTTVTAACGLIVYAAALWFLARRGKRADA
jgi:Co/Zn/Cd efflux system component